MSRQPLLVQPVPALDRLSRYSISRPPLATDLVLDFNESLAPLPVAGASLPVPSANLYPWTARLEGLLADRIAVDAEQVIVTCGADDALERAVRSVCCPGRRVVLVHPTYGMVRRYAILAGAEIVTVPWWEGPFPVDDFCRAAGGNAALAFIVSPNNPTGAVISRRDFESVVEQIPSTLVLHDQAYHDFCDPEFDLTETALSYPNVLLVRTFSKAWGGAGLRTGYAIGDVRVVDWMRRVGQPFPVSRLSLEILETAIEDGGEPSQNRIARIRSQRDDLITLLAELGGEPLPSQASFVLARFEDAGWVRTAMAALGIAIRGFPGRNELDQWLRTTMPGDDASFRRLTSVFRTVLRPEALLFDLDGVIADESRSYRQAIVDTATAFGVALTVADVNAAKASGNSNNDWELTRRLLDDRGVRTSLDEITVRFEGIYHGTETTPGLHRHETLIVEPAWLRALAKRLRLALVTGRPRRDAERFLQDRDIGDVFTVVVTMEDARSKPDPAPVQLALDRLGVRHAWMVGDTPDDIRAARAAGVLPLGIVAPGDDPDIARSALVAAGAARILDRVDTLLEVLP